MRWGKFLVGVSQLPATALVPLERACTSPIWCAPWRRRAISSAAIATCSTPARWRHRHDGSRLRIAIDGDRDPGAVAFDAAQPTDGLPMFADGQSAAECRFKLDSLGTRSDFRRNCMNGIRIAAIALIVAGVLALV